MNKINVYSETDTIRIGATCECGKVLLKDLSCVELADHLVKCSCGRFYKFYEAVDSDYNCFIDSVEVSEKYFNGASDEDNHKIVIE